MKKLNELAALSEELEEFSDICQDNLPIESDPSFSENYQKNLEALKSLSSKYRDIIKQYPDILQSQVKDDTGPIYHRINTGDSQPHKCKVRPILASSEKSKEGRKNWDDMVRLGSQTG